MLTLFVLSCVSAENPLDEDLDKDGYTIFEGDCSDDDPTIHPGDELCDGIDNNCDGEVDVDAVDALSWYADADGDGYGDAENRVMSCEAPSQFVADDRDCDDDNERIHPDRREVCDGVDNDCDGAADDADPDVEVSADLVWYRDADGDGDGDASDSVAACSAPSGYVDTPSDCDDHDPLSFAEGTEILDGADNDCDGSIDETTSAYDDDGDCYCEAGVCTGSTGGCTSLLPGDCDDTDSDLHPNAVDSPDPDFLDANCDGLDGEATASIFVDPSDGDDTLDGTTTLTAVATLDRAFDLAQSTGYAWILLGAGPVVWSGEFVERSRRSPPSGPGLRATARREERISARASGRQVSQGANPMPRRRS